MAGARKAGEPYRTSYYFQPDTLTTQWERPPEPSETTARKPSMYGASPGESKPVRRLVVARLDDVRRTIKAGGEGGKAASGDERKRQFMKRRRTAEAVALI